MNRIFIALSFLFFCLKGTTQTLKPLGIGDTLPDVSIHLLEPTGLKTVKLSAYYQNKPLILDFWASWCAACIKGMTKADSLLKQNNHAVNVLPITYEDEITVRRFIAQRKTMQALRLPFAVRDDLLMGKLFAFRTLPHAVWIGTDGVVKAITYAEEITATNLTAFASNRLAVLREKKDNVDYDPKDPLPVGDSNFIYRSVLTKYQPGLRAVIGAFTKSYSSGAVYDRFIGINFNVLAFYYYCYSRGKSGVMLRDRIELHIKDSLALDPYLSTDATRSIIEPHLYCYELSLPKKVTPDVFFPYLLGDLNRCLPYTASIEKRERLCWVVRSVDTSKHPKKSVKTEGVKWKAGVVESFFNQPIDHVVDYFNWNLSYPVVNETGIGYKVDMDIQLREETGKRVNLFSADSVKESLEQYGLMISLERRLVDILVIRER